MTEIYDIKPILYKLIKVSPYQEHNDTVSDIERIFREAGFYTTREYPIYAMEGKEGRTGRIDLVARRGGFRVAIEYDHKYNVKYKSFQKILQIKPDVAIGITGYGSLWQSLSRTKRFLIDRPLYIVSLKTNQYKVLMPK